MWNNVQYNVQKCVRMHCGEEKGWKYLEKSEKFIIFVLAFDKYNVQKKENEYESKMDIAIG